MPLEATIVKLEVSSTGTTKKDFVIDLENLELQNIANKDEVILDATCQKGKTNRLFSIKEKIHGKDDVIDGMNRAFTTLEKKLIQGL